MKLVTLVVGGRRRAAAVIADHAVPISAIDDLSDAPAHLSDVGNVVRAGPDFMARLTDTVARVTSDWATRGDALTAKEDVVAYASAELLAPFPRPGLVFSTGGNYASHIAEVEAKIGLTIGTPKTPVGFIKNSNAIIGPGAAIELPAHAPEMVDYEAEFSFVIGKACQGISEEEAEDYVVGYTMINDVSGRGWNEQAEKPDGSLDLTLPTFAKQFKTFCPMGPSFVTKDELPDPNNVNFSLKLNGEIMQDGNTGDVIFSIPEILAYFSTWHPFEPGDVVSTGSPAGVGFARNPPVFLKAGDEVTLTADAIGSMTNKVVLGS